jgi:hypothetical protein
MLIKNLPEPLDNWFIIIKFIKKNLKMEKYKLVLIKMKVVLIYLSFEGDSFWTKVRIEDYQHKDVLETLEEKELGIL